ncbi:hypothetical protein ACSQ67_021005 [Phaseolus vulgaris]
MEEKNLCVRRVALCHKNRRVLHRHDQIHLYRDRTATVAATLETATVTTTLETATVAATPETAIVTAHSRNLHRTHACGALIV